MLGTGQYVYKNGLVNFKVFYFIIYLFFIFIYFTYSLELTWKMFLKTLIEREKGWQGGEKSNKKIKKKKKKTLQI